MQQPMSVGPTRPAKLSHMLACLVLALPMACAAASDDEDVKFCEAMERLTAEQPRRHSLGAHARIIFPPDLRETGALNLSDAIGQAPSTSRFALERRAERECSPS